MPIFSCQCKNEWSLALTPPNYKHPGQPLAIRPGVDTGKIFSTCRPIVGVGDQYEVAQHVSKAAASITFCHTISLPHNEQISSIGPNMFLTMVSNRPGPQNLIGAEDVRSHVSQISAT